MKKKKKRLEIINFNQKLIKTCLLPIFNIVGTVNFWNSSPWNSDDIEFRSTKIFDAEASITSRYYFALLSRDSGEGGGTQRKTEDSVDSQYRLIRLEMAERNLNICYVM